MASEHLIESDVLVVGGGMAGSSFCKRGKKSILVSRAKQAGGATKSTN